MRSEVKSMRRAVALTLLALALSGGTVLAGIAGTALTGAASARSPAPTQTDASKRQTHASKRTAATPGPAGTKARVWHLRLAPAPDDFALAQIRFPRARRRAIARDLPQIKMQVPFGADYLAVATPSASPSTGGAQVLVLLVNRPSALEDPASVWLRLSTRGRLAEHAVRSVENPFAQTPAPAARDLCDLTTRGYALPAGALAPLHSTGAALDGFGIAAAVAQAYDVACGLPYESAFKQVLTGVSTQPQPAPQPTPTPPSPQPVPPQPTPEPPHCAPCDPRPGYACPLLARASVCVAGERRLAR
jgi:hypothetical protein